MGRIRGGGPSGEQLGQTFIGWLGRHGAPFDTRDTPSLREWLEKTDMGPSDEEKHQKELIDSIRQKNAEARKAAGEEAWLVPPEKEMLRLYEKGQWPPPSDWRPNPYWNLLNPLPKLWSPAYPLPEGWKPANPLPEQAGEAVKNSPFSPEDSERPQEQKLVPPRPSDGGNEPEYQLPDYLDRLLSAPPKGQSEPEPYHDYEPPPLINKLLSGGPGASEPEPYHDYEPSPLIDHILSSRPAEDVNYPNKTYDELPDWLNQLLGGGSNESGVIYD